MSIDVARWQATLADHVSTLAWSPDGRTLAAGSLGGDAVLFDAATGDTVAKLAAHPLGVLCTAWSPDGRRLAVGGQDGRAGVYAAGGEPVGAATFDGWVTSLAWSPKAGSPLAAGAGRALHLLDGDGAVQASSPLLSSTVTSLVWSVDATRIGVGAYGGLRWYEPPTVADGPVRTFDWKGSLLSVIVAANGRWACAGAQDSSIHLWRLWSGDDLSMHGYPAKIDQLAFRHDSRWMASACLGELTIWDFSGKGPAGSRPAEGNAHDRHIAALAWQPGTKVIATGGADGRLALWSSPRRQGQELTPTTVVEGTGISRLAWSPDGTRLAVGRGDGTVELRSMR